MKKLYTLIAILLLNMAAFAQAPQKMSYQAVVRDAANGLIANQMVGMQISVLQGSDTGTPVYVETQTPTTNANGLASLEIGTGTIVTGAFASIDWSTGTYYIKTETDLAGGTSYTITGASQLLSVPYALHAKTTENFTGTITESQISNLAHNVYTQGSGISITGSTISETNYQIGDYAQGGIVFYVDESGEHGLVIALTDLPSQLSWNAGSTARTMGDALGLYAGIRNTTLIISTQGLGAGNNYAAYGCSFYKTSDEISDWYLPSLYELTFWIYPQMSTINTSLSSNGGTILSTSNYWSSTQDVVTPTQAHWFNFTNNNTGQSINSTTYSVRAIRRF